VSAWPSLYTGTQPGKHGVYYTFQPVPGQQSAQRFGPDQYGYPPFWQFLGKAGKRCTIFDAPYTHPYENFSGIQIFDWGTWACYWKSVSTPAPITRQLTRQCGAYPLGFEANRVGLGSLNLTTLHQRLLKAVASKTESVRWLMTQDPWDLFLVVFGETHPAAHYGWSPASSSAATGSTRSSHTLLQDVYEAIDRAIGEILEQVGEDVTVFVVSGDGVGPNCAGWHLLPEVLQRLGFTQIPNYGQSEDAADPQQDRYRTDYIKKIRDLVPADFRQAISRRLPARWRDTLMSRWAAADIDWSRTRAFCLPTDLEGYIRINVKGREPKGIVNPGTEYNEICKDLSTALQRLINPLTGRPAVRQVIRADEAFPGERRHYLPDLIVLWSEEAEINEVHSPELGTVRSPSPDARTGTHRPPGFVLARGPHVQRGQVLERGHIIDFAPTVLAQFGLPRPQHMDGCAWSDLWANEAYG
jgi:predicted AlkP superfamily phosphohydrolase/phosphomutase